MLVEKAEMLPGAISFTEQALTYNGQPAIARFCSDIFIEIPIAVVTSDQNRLNDVCEYIVNAFFTQEMDCSLRGP